MKTLVFAIFALGAGFSAHAQWNGHQNQVIRCESINHQDNYCRSEQPIMRVRLLQQRSNAPCVQGRTWSYDRGGIFVTAGCRADFEVIPVWNGGDDGDNGNGRFENLRCGSDGRPVLCRTRHRIYQAQILRGNRYCNQRRAWGVDPRGVWTDLGCRGIFRAYYR